MKKLIIALSLMAASVSTTVLSNEMKSTAPDNASVYFISPVSEQTVKTTFTVKFGLAGMGVAPAGTKKKNTGHHHLLIDTDKMPSMHTPLPATDKIKHFGGGQTETTLTLAPGKHTLQLVLGNYLHIPHSKPVLSEKITIIVK